MQIVLDHWLILGGLSILGALSGCHLASSPPSSDWAVYHGHASGDHFSPLQQIDRTNVQSLHEVWRTTWNEPGDPETNPLVIDGTLYGYTPALKVVALEASSGRTRWTFDPGLNGLEVAPGRHFTGPARGMAYWHEGHERRLLVGVMQYLFALDPNTGKPIPGFGTNGALDLRVSLRGDVDQHYVSITTPGMIYRDLIIVGFRTAEASPAPPGDIRAYDVRTGAERWRFHTIPHDGESGSDTWPSGAWKTAGSANNWAGMALDAERGIVYIPTGSAVSDFYGADRIGDDLFANTLLALDAHTGKELWHFQGVHHDLWDRDFSSPPTLLTVQRKGHAIPAIAQTTKQGFVFVFNRVTGEPLFPIRETPYPASDVPGERTSPTQPRPDAPLPFARQVLDESLLTTRTDAAHAWAADQLKSFRSGGQFVPMSVEQRTVVFPGFDGGAEWGGSAADPAHGILYLNANDVAWTGALVKSVAGQGLGSALYQQDCAVCHGPDRAGSPPAFPSLTHLTDHMTFEQIADVIGNGRGRMPPFPMLQSFTLAQLVNFVVTGKDVAAPPAPTTQNEGRADMVASLADGVVTAPYRFAGYAKFLDPDGYPAVKPPWGTLNAIDLNTGKYLWSIPLGNYPELAAKGMSDTGSENYGGPVLTASGLLFIAATVYDHKIRAFDSQNGSLLWEAELPYAGTATPATYRVGNKQYLVIATSNARTPNAPQGGGYVAFALP
jgi:quinoprotein glucose dehydrogenase